MELSIKQLAMFWGMGLLGYVAHILKTMSQAQSTWDMSFMQYLMRYPKQTTIAFIGFIASVAAAYEMGTLNMTTAFAAGYMANSAADVIAGRTIKQMR